MNCTTAPKRPDFSQHSPGGRVKFVRMVNAEVAATFNSQFAQLDTMKMKNLVALGFVVAVVGFSADTRGESQFFKKGGGGLERATFGLGCYSCAEAIFSRLKGVESVAVGYSGGSIKNPTDEQISSKRSGHAEVVDIRYDPKIVSYDELLEVFWKMHDPTTVDQQGKNVGPQYRSVIFYHTNAQRELAEKYKAKLSATQAFNAPIVTEITAFKEFYPAAKSHQDYFGLHPKDEYCTLVIQPKVEEFEKVFAKKLQAPAVAKTDRPKETASPQPTAPRG
jgi:peptide-methionine (S)-S-oxide reductase